MVHENANEQLRRELREDLERTFEDWHRGWAEVDRNRPDPGEYQGLEDLLRVDLPNPPHDPFGGEQPPAGHGPSPKRSP